jgi:hypothetical protein
MIAAQIRRLEVERDPRSLNSLMELMPRKILAERSENILLLINCCFPVYLQWFFSDRSVSFAPTVQRSQPRSAARRASRSRRGRPRETNQPPAEARGKAARRPPRKKVG